MNIILDESEAVLMLNLSREKLNDIARKIQQQALAEQARKKEQEKANGNDTKTK